MGLDMYLNVRRLLSEEDGAKVLSMLSATAVAEARDPDDYYYLTLWEHSASEERSIAEAIVEIAGLTPLLTTESPSGGVKVGSDGIVTVAVHGMYWRKANAIHAWFVENCQDGVDECQESDPIPAEQLAHLIHQCKEALNAYRVGDPERAESIMAPRSGFFFGGTDIDESWAQDMTDTIAGLEGLVTKAIAVGGITFTYRSSW